VHLVKYIICAEFQENQDNLRRKGDMSTSLDGPKNRFWGESDQRPETGSNPSDDQLDLFIAPL
jgi:hypothetical protein